MRTFYEWLINQKYREDVIGDLAKDIFNDDNLPEKKTKRTLLSHLVFLEVDEQLLSAFEESWQEYKIFRSNMIK